MNLKFLAGLAVVIALVSGLAVINLAKQAAYTSEGQRVSLPAPTPTPTPTISDTAAVDTSVNIAEHSVETKVEIK